VVRVVVEMWEKMGFVYCGGRVRKVVVVCWYCNMSERLDWGGQYDGEDNVVLA